MAIRILLRFLFVFLLLTSSIYGADSIWLEDCEDTVFTEHFLEDQYGGNTEVWWEDFKVEVTQSATAYDGSYSMVYNPWVTSNPRAIMGFGNMTYGNLTNFDLSSYDQRYWYFRWYQRWEDSAYTGINKMFYLNYIHGNFCMVVQKTGDDSFQVLLYEEGCITPVISRERSHTSSVDDENFHKFTVYLDVGTTGGNNAAFIVNIDGVELTNETGIDLNSTISSSPIETVYWPSNISGSVSGSQNTWLDNLGIWTVTGPTDIPGEGEDTTPPEFVSCTVQTVGTSVKVIFDESVIVNGEGLTLTMSGGATTILYASGSGSSEIFYSSSRTIQDGETGTYDFSGCSDCIEDSTGNDAEAVVDGEVINDSTQGAEAPGAIGATYNAAAPAVEYSANAVSIVSP